MSGLDCEVCGSMARTRKALAHHMIMEHPLLVEQSLPEGYDKKQYMVRAEEKVKQANDRKEGLQQYADEIDMKRAAANRMRAEAEAAASEAKAEEESAFVDNVFALDV